MTTTANTTTATYTRLRTGAWGVRGTDLTAGAEVTITKRDGTTSDVTIDTIVWTDGTTSIATIIPTGFHTCAECGNRFGRRAYDMSGIPGWACARCDDGTLCFG